MIDDRPRSGGARQIGIGGRPSYRWIAPADGMDACEDLARLDAPYPAVGGDDAETRTSGAFVGHHLVAVASVSRHQPPGPPMRGIYRIHGVAARGTGCEQITGLGVIERCISYAAAGGGRMLWCCAPLSAVHLWRRHGFALAGPPCSGAGMLLMRPITVVPLAVAHRRAPLSYATGKAPWSRRNHVP